MSDKLVELYYNDVDITEAELKHIYELDLVKEAKAIHNEVVLLCMSEHEYGTEGFKTILYRLFVHICNHIASNFLKLGYIFRKFKNLHMTEWDKYRSENRKTVSIVRSSNYSIIGNSNMPYPRGMISTYMDVLSKVLPCLTAFDMVNRSTSFNDICNVIYTRYSSGDFSIKNIPALEANMIDITNVKALFDKYNKMFDPKKGTDSRPFNTLFTSMDDFRAVGEILEKNNKFLYQVHTVMNKVDSANKHLKNTLKVVQNAKDSNDVTLTKQDLLSLSNACMFFAETTDMYGVTTQDYHRIEHNYVEVHRVIYANKLYEMDNSNVRKS